ncbi:MAG: M48 family metalloprotease [Deltaproteobacteria bacterium]|nr:M48 family metalloprotease [Deltaproteobacteria bacterium]MBW2068798.1 M48 family metalloprotease [Deltaproteobacteria bacterium]
MYTQIIYFLVVLFVFTTGGNSDKLLLGNKTAFLLTCGQFYLFHLICKYLYGRAAKRVWAGLSIPSMAQHAIESLLNIVAIFFLVLLTYVVQVKRFINHFEIFRFSPTLTALVGLCFYFFYLVIMWRHTVRFHQRFAGSNVVSKDYVKQQFVLYAGLLVPWLFLSGISEILEHLLPFRMFQTETGEFILFAFGLVLFVTFGPSLMVKAWRCKPILAGERRAELEKFCKEQGFIVKDLLLWPLLGGKGLTAAVVGFLPRWRYILITPGLYHLLNDDELKAVLAHELGHIKLRHMPFYLLFFVAFSAMLYIYGDVGFLLLMKNSLFLQMVFDNGALSQTVLALVCSVPLLAFLIVYFRFVFGYFIRNCERQADLYSMRVIGNPWSLISAFKKISLASGNIEDLPSWHHYSIRQRIEFLKAAYYYPALGVSHDVSLKRAMVVFAVTFVLLAGGGILLKRSEWYKDQGLDVIIHMLAGEFKQKGVTTGEIYAMYGGYLLEKHRYGEAERVLERGLELYPENAEVLNNLAWLYVTAPEPYRSPEKAVALASKAVKLAPDKPYIWDTLAEAYYITAQYEKALNAISRAVKLDSNPYYARQMQKILKALKKQ